MPLLSDEELQDKLAEGLISAITVDTNIFDEKGLRFNSATLQAIAALKDRPISFVLSGTVAKEVQNHLEREIEAALRAAKKGIGQALNAFDTSQPTRDDILATVTGGRTASDAAEQRFAKYVNDTGCEVLEDTELVDTSKIFNSYFAKEPPFGSGKKKDEFPDALALNALEETAKQRGTGVLVVSKDGDWRAFCEQSQRLFLLPDIERALALVNDAPLGLRQAVQEWFGEDADGKAEVYGLLERRVEHLDFSVNGQASSGELEAIPWAGILKDVDWPVDGDIDLIETESTDDGKTISVLASLPLVLTVQVPIELNFSVWDSVDRESLGMGGRTIEFDEDLYVRATAKILVHDFGTEDQDLELQSVDLDMTGYEIELGEVDMFEPEDYWDESEPESA